MSKIPVLGTGLNGLVGSKLASDFATSYDFDNLDLSDPKRPVDITKYDDVAQVFESSKAEVVVHFAAFTDVTKAWAQNGDKSGSAYRVNVIGTQNIVQAAEATGKHLIHISTAYVFDGNKDELYVETDLPNPIEWYGQTKLLAEEAVLEMGHKASILRIDQPFRSDVHLRKDIVRRLLESMSSGKLYPQFVDHSFGPTWIDDFAKVIDWFIRTKSTGVFHASSGESWSDFEFAVKLKNLFYPDVEIVKGHLGEYLKTLGRPYQKNTAMSNQKLVKSLDFKLKSINQALEMVILDKAIT